MKAIESRWLFAGLLLSTVVALFAVERLRAQRGTFTDKAAAPVDSAAAKVRSEPPIQLDLDGPPPVPTRPGEPWNDRMVRGWLEVVGSKLVDRQEQISGPELVKQLGRRTCKLKLPAAAAAAAAGKPSLEELLVEVERSVGVVGRFYKCSKCAHRHLNCASGFFISDSGAFVTSRHVLSSDSLEGLVVMTRDGRLHAVREVLASGEADDVAILQVEGTGFSPLLLRDAVTPGTPILVLSHPENNFYSVSTGLVSRYLERSRDGAAYLAITADFAKGSSGAPVFTGAGEVVGVVNSTHTIYAQDTPQSRTDPQMVIKLCNPASAIRGLIEADRPAS